MLRFLLFLEFHRLLEPLFRLRLLTLKPPSLNHLSLNFRLFLHVLLKLQPLLGFKSMDQLLELLILQTELERLLLQLLLQPFLLQTLKLLLFMSLFHRLQLFGLRFNKQSFDPLLI